MLELFISYRASKQFIMYPKRTLELKIMNDWNSWQIDRGSGSNKMPNFDYLQLFVQTANSGLQYMVHTVLKLVTRRIREKNKFIATNLNIGS